MPSPKKERNSRLDWPNPDKKKNDRGRPSKTQTPREKDKYDMSIMRGWRFTNIPRNSMCKRRPPKMKINSL